MTPRYKLLTAVEPATATRSELYCATNFQKAKLPEESDLTLYQTFTNAVEKFGGADCLGARRVNADGEAGDYEFWTYTETAERTGKVASAMKGVGLPKGSKVGVFGINCREWMLSMQACNRMSYVCVPIYDTLGENAVEYIINHSETSFVFLDAVNLPKLEKALPKVKGYLKNVVYWGNTNEESVEKIRGMKVGVHSFEAFVEKGATSLVPPDPPKPDDICTIMYTSGTTGDPKGVTLTHKAVASGVYSLKAYCDHLAPQGPGDRYISYLPLAHIFDRMGEELTLAIGSCIGYWQGSLPKLVDDIAAFRPTFFVGVPRVFDRMYTRIMHGVEEGGFIKKFLFEWGYNRKAQAIKEGVPQDRASPLFDKIVFNKVKQRLGGCVRLIITGGAPIAPHTEEFMKVCFCSPVVQGYGLTETCAGSFITAPDDPEMEGTVGPPLPFVTFCLESVPEMNYNANGNVQEGEVCIKTPFVFSNYYKSPDLTAEVLEDDGLFHTGDIGRITPEGALKLVDRKKNILKLSQGEYVALEKVEGAYKESTVVEQIWVYGDSFKNFLVAVVVPTVEFVKKWAAENSKAFDYPGLCKDASLRDTVKSVLDAMAKEKALKGFETVRAFQLESEQFSVENDLITPTFKLKRPQLQRKYQEVVNALYAA